MERASEIRLLIADDHPIFRQGLRHTIESQGRWPVVAEAGNGQEALARITQDRVTIAILDIDMPVLDGFAVARAIAEHGWPVAVIFLTMHQDEHFLQAALAAGVKGYVLKDCATLDILNCIRAVAAGQYYLSPQFSTFLVARTQGAGARVEAQYGLEQLTAAERKVLRLIAEYKTSRQIAGELGVSPRTVENHRAKIVEKLGLKGTHGLLKFALQHQSEIE